METFVTIVCLVVVASTIGAGVYWQYKTNFYWKFIGKIKWREVQADLENIEQINGQKISWLDKNLAKSTKKKFDASKQAYVEYIEFCIDKHLDLPATHEQIETLIDETEDKLLNPDEAMDKELRRTAQQYDAVYDQVQSAGETLLLQRRDAIALIEDIEDLVNSIARQPKVYATDLTEISVQKKSFKSTMEFANEQSEALKNSAKGVGAGVVAGAAVAGIAPSAAMWVATTFGTASTGAAISSLSGAAASQAALAYLGGGAVAAGGGGVAAGQALLALAGPIGIGVAGTTVAASVLFTYWKKQKIRENKRDEIARMKKCVEALKEVKGKIDSLSIKTDSFYDKLDRLLTECEELRGLDYTTISDGQRHALGVLVNDTKALSALLNQTV